MNLFPLRADVHHHDESGFIYTALIQYRVFQSSFKEITGVCPEENSVTVRLKSVQ